MNDRTIEDSVLNVLRYPRPPREEFERAADSLGRIVANHKRNVADQQSKFPALVSFAPLENSMPRSSIS